VPAFKFRLEFLITLRRRKEEEAAARLAKRLASIRDLENQISLMEEERERLSSDLSRMGQEGRLTGPILKLYSDFQAKLRKDIRQAEELLFLSKREEAKERAALRAAVMDRQLMEKIKEKQKKAHGLAELKRDQEAMEELSALRRNGRAEGGSYAQ
jgi:flagellar export protein FliJ